MKPIVQKISPFDANYSFTINIIWSGTIPNSNEIVIYEADTLTQIYQQKIESHSLTHEVPANTLSNGKQYVIQCYVYDADDIQSDISDKVHFRTFTTPSFVGSVENINDKDEINISSATMVCVYEQAENEPLALYKFCLFDRYNDLLYETTTYYTTEKSDNKEYVTHTFNGLDNGSEYYVQCIGSTSNGISVTTELIHFIVCQNASNYAKFTVKTEPQKGWNQWSANISIVSYRGKEKFTYVKDGEGNLEYIDLTNKSIYYGDDKSISIPDDCSIIISGKGFQSGVIFECVDSQTFEHLIISAYIYDDKQIRFKVVVNNGLSDYIIYSSPLPFNHCKDFVIEVQKKNNLYNIISY